jgi:hypothetical protein
MSQAIGRQLEQYTIGTMARSPEVLIVKIEMDGELEEVVIFKGFSSSLSRATATDPDVPVIPDGANIISIDRLQSPYNPSHPIYIARGLSWEAFSELL